MTEPSPRLQWVIVVLAYLVGLAVCVWLVARGWWYLAVVLVGSSVVLGLAAWREGKPLFPGGRERGSRD
jgi:hypothetical protein